jgi:hypothetical protein
VVEEETLTLVLLVLPGTNGSRSTNWQKTMKDLKFDRKRRHSIVSHCPCGKSNKDGKFAPFLGYTDKGHCHSCGETFFPDKEKKGREQIPAEKGKTHIDYIPFDTMETSVMLYEKCNLFPLLDRLFRHNLASWLCRNYLIGSSKSGATAFWQVDTAYRVRQVKVINFDQDIHRSKRVPPVFAGKKILGDAANLSQCFFGEHLLVDDHRPVAITEGEKTAVIASVYFPRLVWIATGGKFGCSFTEKSKASVLRGRKVILFPDADAYNLWSEKAPLLAAVAGCHVRVSDTLEKNTTVEEKVAGLDIADFLLKVTDKTGLALTDYVYPAMWDFNLYNY